MLKKATVLLVVLSLMLTAVGMASAQQRPNRQAGLGELAQVISDATGLTIQEIRSQLDDETTLADIITANGGDVDAVIAETEAIITEQINTALDNGRISEDQATMLLENLTQNITDAVNGEGLARDLRNRELRDRFDGDLLRGMGEALTDATGLSAQEIVQQVRDGATLEDLLTANGSSIEAIVTDLVAETTTAVEDAVANGRITEEQAATMLENLETRITDALSGDGVAIFNRIRENRGNQGNRFGFDNRTQGRILQEVVDATGLDAQEITTQLRDGTPLGDILTDAGVNVDEFIAAQLADLETVLAQAVENDRMSQAVADAQLQLREAQLNDLMTRSAQR